MDEITEPKPVYPNIFRAMARTPNGRELTTEEALEVWLDALERHNGVPAEDPVTVTWELSWTSTLNGDKGWTVSGPAYPKGMKP